MTTDGGGWTLFLSYFHTAKGDVKLDSTVMPTDPEKGASHMNL
jgi:hypothetical protein